MGRSLKKGPFVDDHLMKKVVATKTSGSRKPIRTWSRRSMVVPDFVGMTMEIHNGKDFITVFVSENMVGHRLGEFALTRVFRAHGAHTEKTTK